MANVLLMQNEPLLQRSKPCGPLGLSLTTTNPKADDTKMAPFIQQSVCFQFHCLTWSLVLARQHVQTIVG